MRCPNSSSVASCRATLTPPQRVKSGTIINGREILDMSDPNWISAANPHHSESVLSKIRTDSGVEASSRSSHFCRTLKQTVKTLPNATANDIWLGAVCDAATCPQCSPTASHRLTATLVGPRALMFTAVRAGRPHPRGFRFARHPDSGSGTEKQTSEAAMVERRDRAPTRPPAGRNQFGALISVIISGTYRFGSAGALSLINWPKRVR